MNLPWNLNEAKVFIFSLKESVTKPCFLNELKSTDMRSAYKLAETKRESSNLTKQKKCSQPEVLEM